MGDESEEDEFDVIRPSLIRELKNILEQYPDNGQILKEIIQNAEDAGAKVVRFLYDENDVSTIFGQGIEELQGPSLYSYNDAYFSEGDWKGIRMIGESLKEKDPLKVGRFGLGFKSIYHITDNPTIMSNHILGISNPDEQLFSTEDKLRTGKVIDFMKKKEELFNSQSLHEDCSDVYRDLLGLDIDSGMCRGSVFRFHLRNQPSKLSKTIYDKKKIMELFESFKGEGHLSLVFMKNLEKIEFFVRRKGEVTAHLVSSFAVHDEDKGLMLDRKKEFVIALKRTQAEDTRRDESIVFQTTISVMQKRDDVLESKKRFKYAIIFHYAGKVLSDDDQMTSIANDRGFIPLVGIAFPYEKDLPTGGHVFCTLPLPVLGNASTSLPVHVNGFFALGPDRKDLKWGSTQDIQSSDQQVMWNQFLIEKVLPAAYEHLFTSMTSLPIPATASEVYDMLPDLSRVDAKWKKLAEALFRRIFHLPCLWTDACQGKWIPSGDALFKQNYGHPGLDIAVECMLRSDLHVVKVPKHIELAFCQLYDNTDKPVRRYIEPMLVCEVLKTRPEVLNFGYKDRMELLGYLISAAEDLDSLVGVAVLPLENGSFAALKCSYAEPIYVPTDKHPKCLLPGLEGKLLKTDIDATLREIFIKAAAKGKFQLAMLNEEIVSTSIKEVFTYEDNTSSLSLKCPAHKATVAEWLRKIWHYIRDFNLISQLDDLPLIPLEDASENVDVFRCSRISNRSIILYLSSDMKEQAWADFMTGLGFIVIAELPLYIFDYREIFGVQIFELNAKDVLSLFQNMSSRKGFEMLLAVFKAWEDVTMKMKLKDLLLDIRHWDIDAKDLVRKLPLFENSLDDGLTSLYDVNQIAPSDMPGVRPRTKLLCCNDDTSQRLASLLGAEKLTKERFIEDVIIPEIKQQQHDGHTIDELMKYILPDVAASRFSQLSSIAFVCTADSRRYRPNELFDSTDPNLQILLGPDYPKFPAGMYTKEPFIYALKKLGLKTADKIASEDIQHIATNISVCADLEVGKQKALCLVKHIEKHPSLLCPDANEMLQTTSWVPALQKRPNDYPDTLTWHAEQGEATPFDKPINMALEENVRLVGAVKQIVPKEYLNKNLMNAVFQPDPYLLDVLKQLQHVTRDYSERNRSQYALVVTKIYAFLSSRDPTAIKKSMEEMGQFEWVWNGEGFASAEKILVDDFSLDLKPFIWRMPKEMENFKKLFLDLGSSRVCSEEMLIRVLEEIQGNYDDNTLETSEAAAKNDLKLSVEILSKLKNEPLSTQLRERLVVPIHTQQYLKFDLADNTVYAPNQPSITYDYEATNDGEATDDSGVDGEIKYLHPIIPEDVATALGIRSLTSKMLGAEDLGLFEEYGQTEPLTRRINRILQDYGDGSAIIKELVQNADDAGAVDVKFLYDERQNTNLRTSLIDPGMRDFQGPALWAYNSAVFTKQDFDNITKLSGATKEYERDKIGRFGLGFNAVYNLTDVPSFVSEDQLVIFDPHTTNLGRAISNKSKPGVKINVGTNRGRLKHFKDQLAPFHGIFGMNMNLDATHQSFPGTLFRFPLRTRQQAANSEIKDLYYDKVEMKKLLSKFAMEADKILVFTQNVCKIQVFHLEENVSPSEMKELISVTKTVAQEIRPLVVNGGKHKATQVMRASAHAVERAGRNPGDYEQIYCSNVHSIQVVMSRDGRDYFQNNMSRDANDKWLIHSMSGSIDSKSLKMAFENGKLNPLASIAISVSDAEPLTSLAMSVDDPDPLASHAMTVDDRDTKGLQLSFHPLDRGQYFCFLPLPIANGLPVHVNSTFAVTADRKSIKQVNEDDKNNTTTETQWNSAIMADPVATAYLAALEDLTCLTRLDKESEWFELWPTRAYEYSSYHDCLLESFYGNMIRNQLRLLPAVSARTWVAWRDIIVVDYNLDADIKTHLESVITQFPNNRTLIDLPLKVITTINDCGLKEQLQSVIIKFEGFFTEVFIEKLQHADMPVSARNSIVLFLIENLQKYPDLKSVFMQTRCIPTLPHGTLKSPVELVKPKSKASNLFAEADEVFPYGEEFNRSSCLETLETLGMIADNPKWEVLESRAGTISSMKDHKSATTRSRYLIRLIDEKLQQEKPGHETLLRWRDLEFLPTKSAPPSWSHLPWAGGSSKRFCNVGEIYPSCLENLVCCHSPVIDEGDRGCGKVSQRVFDFFKIPTEAKLEQVFMQINEIAEIEGSEVTEPIKKMLHGIYRFLDEICKDDRDRESVGSRLNDHAILAIGKRLVKAGVTAIKQEYSAEPYLFKLPVVLLRYESFLSAIGVKETFDLDDYIYALGRVEVECRNIRLEQAQIKLVRDLLESVDNLRNGKEVEVFLPDDEAILQPKEKIHVKDAKWVRDEPSLRYIHPQIPDSLALSLGAKTARSHSIRKQSKGIPFGQHEKLTVRLKKILDGYPGEMQIIHEILQNADDAGATKLAIILDGQMHPSTRVFSDKWKPLQGPAILFSNNASFTESDLQGIQDLGEGSKSDDPLKTGQYGVGFNVVYHVTDAPSLLTHVEGLGSCLCIFDPHAKFLDECSQSEPGRMFSDARNFLRRDFPDIYASFIPDMLTDPKSTIFRLPLRNLEMARKSKIKGDAISVDDLRGILKKFKSEAAESLLFLKNVEEIEISEITANGEAQKLCSISSEYSQASRSEKSQLNTEFKTIADIIKNKNRQLSCDEFGTHCYDLTVNQALQSSQNWVIIQKNASVSSKVLPAAVSRQYDKELLRIFPSGGIAINLEEAQTKTGNKVYCLLPLHVSSNLPLHINGNFVLDYETRRRLWFSEESCFQKDWNNYVIEKCIIPCYLALLERFSRDLTVEAGEKCVEEIIKGTFAELRQCDKTIHPLRIEQYFNLLPTLCKHYEAFQYKEYLVKMFYKTLSDSEARLLPVLRASSGTQKISVDLCPSNSSSKRFYIPDSNLSNSSNRFNAEQIQSICSLLLKVGMNLYNIPQPIVDSFENSGVPLKTLSPRVVIDYLRKNATAILNTPKNVSDTIFKDVATVTSVLRYCLSQEEIGMADLEGLPLLLTEDNYLRIISSSTTIYFKDLSGMFPGRKYMCLHPDLRVHLHRLMHSSPYWWLRKLGVSALNRIMHEELDGKLKGSAEIEQSPDFFPAPHWLIKLWNFLRREHEHECKEHSKQEDLKRANRRSWYNYNPSPEPTFEGFLQGMSQWCFVPIERVLMGDTGKTTQKKLMRISSIKSVVSVHCMSDIVDKLGLPRLDKESIDFSTQGSNLRTFPPTGEGENASYIKAKKLIATDSDPASFLQALHAEYKRPNSGFQRITCELSKSILEFFNGKLYDVEWQQSCYLLLLKSLPLFEDICGCLQTLDTGRNVFRIPRKMPTEGISLIKDVIFLKENWDVRKLFELLGIAERDLPQVYRDHIFPCFVRFTNDQRLAHLEFLREKIESHHDQSREQLLEHLKELAFIETGNGSLTPASSFYDAGVEIFKIMLEEDAFPPAPFCEGKWLQFLRDCGLITSLSSDLFLRFAKEISQISITSEENKQEMLKKSKALVDYLIESESRSLRENTAFLEALSSIQFLVADSLPENLRKILAVPEQRKICFQGALENSPKTLKLAWTVENMLPLYASRQWCGFTQCSLASIESLNVQKDSPAISVARNLVNICTQSKLLKRTSNGVQQLTEEKMLADLEDVFDESYDYLSKKQSFDTTEVDALLKDNTVIIVNGGQLVIAKKTTLEEKSEIPPYLFSVPVRFGKYFDFFTSLGTTKTATSGQFVGVLREIHACTSGKALSPNEAEAAFRASRSLSRCIGAESDASWDSILYLPGNVSASDETLKLFSSKHLVYFDDRHFEDRLRNLNRPRIALNVDFEENDLKILVKKLPEEFRPIYVSKIISEKLLDSERVANLDFAEDLQNRLQSQEFANGMLRLLMHQSEQQADINEESRDSWSRLIASTRVATLAEIKTVLCDSGEIIDGSERTKDVFVIQEDKALNLNIAQEKAGKSGDQMMYSVISRGLAEYFQKHLTDPLLTPLLNALLQCSLEEIEAFLDEQNIRRSSSQLSIQFNPGMYQIGDFVPIKLHCLLVSEIVQFRVGEYVAYEAEDPMEENEEGEATYIYARVVSKEDLNDDAKNNYKIECFPDKFKVVHYSEIYRFERQDEFLDADSGASSSEALQAKLEQDLAELLDVITKTIKDAFKEDKTFFKFRKKIVKRLYLRWHPDRNPGREEFCTKVSQHIQAEVAKLENIPEVFFTNFRSRGSRFGSTRRNFKSGESSYSWFGRSGSSQGYWGASSRTKNPQPGEARRWYRQAKSDFKAASVGMDIVPCEWICQQCHQAAEKGIKAAVFTIDSKRTNHHDLRKIARDIENSKLNALAAQLEELLGSSTKLRYPNMWPYPAIPNTQYDRSTALEALKLTGKLMEEIKSRVRESSDGCINQTDDFEVWTDYIDVMQGSPGSSLKRTASEHLAEAEESSAKKKKKLS